MMPRLPRLGFAVCAALVSLGCNALFEAPVETIEITEYRPPRVEEDGLIDDRIADKQTQLDPALVDSRPLDGWRINQSEAVVHLAAQQLTPPAMPPDVKSKSEAVQSTIVKVYSLDDQGVKYRAYVVKYKEAEVVATHARCAGQGHHFGFAGACNFFCVSLAGNVTC